MPAADPCALHIQIRSTIRAPWPVSERRYTIPELAQLWHRSPKTLRNWLWRMRKAGAPPQPGQLTTRRLISPRSGRPSPFRREQLWRADYVRLMAEIFVERVRRL